MINVSLMVFLKIKTTILYEKTILHGYTYKHIMRTYEIV